MRFVTALLFACIGLFLGAKSDHTNPVVAWTFDKTNGSTLIPDFTSDERFFADLKSLEEEEPLRPGVVGNGIFLSGTTFKIANSLTTEDCLFDSESCLGLHLSFWVKIERWNSDNEQSLLKTITTSRSLPGIFFGKGDDTHLLVYIRGSEGKTYETTLPSTYLLGRWGHLDIWWSKANQSITIHLNDTYITEETTIGKAPPIDSRSDVAVTNLVLGGPSGPTFLMDELEVYYQCNNSLTGEHHTTNAHTTHRSTWIAATTTEELTTSMPFSTATTVLSDATQTQSPVTSTTSPADSKFVFYIFATIIVLVLVLVVAIWYCRRRQRRNRRRDEPDGVRLFDIDRERLEPYRDSDTDLTDS